MYGKNPITSDSSVRSTKATPCKGNSGPSDKAYTPTDYLAKKLAGKSYGDYSKKY